MFPENLNMSNTLKSLTEKKEGKKRRGGKMGQRKR